MDDKPAQSVAAQYAGQRLDNYLARVLKPVPKTRIYRMLRRGEVRVNGGRAKPDYRVQAGDRLRLPPLWGLRDERSAHPPHSRQWTKLERRILFEDDGLLVLDKPAGLAVHGGSGVRLGLIETLRAGRPKAFLELAHRLDRDTSGCLIIAKSRAALGELHRLQRVRQVVKSYELLACGRWPNGLQLVELPLHRYVAAAGERRVRVAQQGKPARTRFSQLRLCDAASWLRARLHTGRTHQIRVHAAASGHPLLGDDKYGTAASALRSQQAGAKRLCLHAASIRLPWRGEDLRVSAAVPRFFAQAWRLLQSLQADIA